MNKNTFSIKISPKHLKSAFMFLLVNCRMIVFSAVLYAFLIFSLAIFVYYYFPLRSKGKLEFNINSDLKANKSDDSKDFNVREIISTEVLYKVYQNDDLERVFNSFDKFQKSISIVRQNDTLMFLNAEYSKKLSSEDLSEAAKMGLQQEYLREKQNSIKQSNYCLIFNCDSTSRTMKADDVLKIMSDIVGEWLRLAVKYKGITRYNISLNTKNSITKETLDSLDYLMGVDLLRNYLIEVGKDIEKIETLPNSKFIRISTDSGAFSLSDIKMKYNFLKNYQLEPLLGIIQETAKPKDDLMVGIYLKNKLENISSELEVVQHQKQLLNESGNIYDTDQSNRLKRINEEFIQLKKEQNFYNKLKKSLSENDKNPSEGYDPEKIEMQIKQQQYHLLTSIYQLIDMIQEFSASLSKANLGRVGDVITEIGASAYISRGMNLKFLIIAALAGWLVCVAITIKIIFLIKHFFPELKKELNRQDGADKRKVETDK